MTQISKRKVGKEIENAIYSTFFSNIAKLTKKEDVESFFSDLFTKTERVNFTKRLAIAVLLFKSYDWASIKDILKVSLGTIAKVASKKNSPGYELFLKKLQKEAQWQKFWEDLVKTHLLVSHPDKYSRLGEEGIEKIYLKKKNAPLY